MRRDGAQPKLFRASLKVEVFIRGYSQLKPRAKNFMYLDCFRQEIYPGILLVFLSFFFFLLNRASVLTFDNVNSASFRSPLAGARTSVCQGRFNALLRVTISLVHVTPNAGYF